MTSSMGHSSTTRHSLYDDGASHSVMTFRDPRSAAGADV
jgi:hypothetical protein